ncbi:DUF1365 domain-containing protein [Candidatus Pelagibacter sp.]|nr:DUF1365 domain-containing protein [Candidatus Pelagibacter sp.]
MLKSSKIYVGKVIHRRFKPKSHYFKYRVFSLLIDLDDLNEIDNKIKLFSYNKFNIISFFDKDHGDRDGTSLKNWVKKKLENIGIDNREVKIKLFCYPRILGYVFNPLSVFFIYDEYDKIISIFYEVKNTFGEQHTYIFKAEDSETLRNSCVKKFHVSPFIDMECNYKFRVNKPSDKISVIIDQSDNDGKLLFASQDGTAKEFSNKNLFVSYIFHPLMTFKVIVAIHYEAFKLWVKGIKFIKKKINIKNNSSVEKSEFE